MDKKEFWKSKAFWGAVIMMISFWAPQHATFLQGSLDDVMMVIGGVMTLIGRWTATKALTTTPQPETIHRK